MHKPIDPQRIAQFWETHALPGLLEFLRIPNVSPAFDPAWEQHGAMDRAVQSVTRWFDQQQIPQSTLHTVRLPGRTPFLLWEIAGEIDTTVVLYGHLDKQPGATGWMAGCGPWEPIIQDNKLYGRGAVDDGYAFFLAVAAIKLLTESQCPLPRILLLIECSEESGSPDLMPSCAHFASVIGVPDLVICLDAGAATFEQPWISTSARGVLTGTLKVQVLETGIHSGASGVVPSSFRILRHLLDRVEDAATGVIHPAVLQVPIPTHRIEEARALAQALGKNIVAHYPWLPGMGPASRDPLELILNRSWRATMSQIGLDGMPSCQAAGSVLRPYTHLKLSFRLPPTLAADRARHSLRDLLTRDPPYGARVAFEIEDATDGWEAQAFSPALAQRVQQASAQAFGKPPMYMGLGGSIPFLALFGRAFPQSQCIVTGALGPHSNAHGPNECLEIPFVKRLTGFIAGLLADYRG